MTTWADLRSVLWPCGHARTPENTLRNGSERCRECHRVAVAAYWDKAGKKRRRYIKAVRAEMREAR